LSLQTPERRFLTGHETTTGEKNLKFGIQGKISFKLSYMGIKRQDSYVATSLS
ncbi:unnamed protein product, partial [Arabidopsis halleri]